MWKGVCRVKQMWSNVVVTVADDNIYRDSSCLSNYLPYLQDQEKRSQVDN